MTHTFRSLRRGNAGTLPTIFEPQCGLENWAFANSVLTRPTKQNLAAEHFPASSHSISVLLAAGKVQDLNTTATSLTTLRLGHLLSHPGSLESAIIIEAFYFDQDTCLQLKS